MLWEKRMGIIVAGLAALAVTVGVDTQGPPQIERPSAVAMERYYPSLPELLLLSGQALLQCDRVEEGQASSCELVAESPQGLGFGLAALKMISERGLKLQTTGGGLAEDKVRVLVPFEPPPIEALEAGRGYVAPVSSEHAKRLARQLFGQEPLSGLMARVRAMAEKEFAEEAAEIESGGVNPRTSGKAKIIFEDAIRRHFPDLSDMFALELAAHATEAQLEQALAAPQGRPTAALAVGLSKVNIDAVVGAYGLKVTESARRGFCAAHNCATSPLYPTETSRAP